MSSSYLGLENAHVLITGASGGLGVVLARLLVSEAGARVTAHHNAPLKTDAPLALLAAELGPTHLRTVQADVTDEDQVAAAVAAAAAPSPHQWSVCWGPPTILVVAHGIWPTEDVAVADMDLTRWRRTLAVNLDGTFLFLKHWHRAVASAALPSTFTNISAVLIGSTAGGFGEAYHADYASSKAAFQPGGLLRSLKNELPRTLHPRARINTVAPGWIRTPMAARALADPNLLGQAMATSPLRKVSEPEDVARAVMWAASGNAAGNVTGTVIHVDAGMEGRLLWAPPASKL
ncbi:hypothetical protein BC828DRAFT_356893 [Blastocladiella britannica]|nr:hypothetical protein BC828DRAFT_356893 [Blastocladiella britannica]